MGTWEAIKAIIILLPKVMKIVVALGRFASDIRVKNAIDEASQVAEDMNNAQDVKQKFVAIRKFVDLWHRG